MDAFLQVLCLFCTTIGSTPHPQLPRGVGDIWVTHEMLGRSTHLLRLSTTDFILDSDAARDDRLDAFARSFGGETCGRNFELSVAERSSWPETRPRYAKQYRFRCR